MLKYNLNKNGSVKNICIVKNDYQIGGDELLIDAVEITASLIESLHSDEYKTQRAIDEQKEKCIQLLNETDCKLVSDSPYSTADKTLWKTYRSTLRNLISGNVLGTIPDKPF